MKKIWILIYVHHGLIQEPEIFFEIKKAQSRKENIMKVFNPDYDEIDIYAKMIS